MLVIGGKEEVQILTTAHLHCEKKLYAKTICSKLKMFCIVLTVCQTCDTFLSSCCCAAVLSSASGVEGEVFGMGMWSLGLGAIGAALAGILLANTDLCLPKVEQASLESLEQADLRSTVDGSRLSD